MRVVLDANVLIASFAGRGLCHSLVEWCVTSDEIVSTESILDDVREKHVKKLRVPARIADEAIRFLRSRVVIVEPADVAHGTCRDADDHDVLGAAAAGGAEYIVSGDEDLLVLKEYAGIPIVSPRAYWDVVQKRNRK